MPLAALVAMKPTVQQSVVFAAQRVIGTVLGAIVAVVLLAVGSARALELVLIVLAMLPGAIRDVGYTYYTAAVAAVVLIAIDLPNPCDLASEGRRVLFTLIGVGIAVLVMSLASVVQKRAKPSRTVA